MKKYIAIVLGGLIFGFGLAYSGMTRQEIVLSFLQLRDLGLLFVMGMGVLVTMIGYHLLAKILKKPVLCGTFQDYGSIITKPRLAGAVIFGVGWGISGLCPGSALASLGTGNLIVAAGLLCMFLGAYVQGRFLRE